MRPTGSDQPARRDRGARGAAARCALQAALATAVACSAAARADQPRPIPQLVAPAEPDSQADLPEVEVRGHYDNAVGTSDAASQGVVTSRLLQARPALRPAEVLEAVPGLIVTQHSGGGKANQYFLRGFNLDHGTDFATRVAGVPVNLPTHAHGHGYTDLNFLIPELVDRIEYRKGPYFAANGDFSSAGSADIAPRDRLPEAIGQLTLGSHGYRRLLVAGSSAPRAGAALLGALELQGHDGPWDIAQRLRRLNGVVRYTDRVAGGDLAVTLMGYASRWNATDQIPARAVAAGLIGRFGTIDPTDGGRTARLSASADWRSRLRDGSFEASAYAVRYGLDLFSNFTYFLDRPGEGDQFAQRDRRTVLGGALRRIWLAQVAGLATTTELGLQVRQDRIQVGLFDSVARQIVATTRDDAVRQDSVALYAESGVTWTPWLRTLAGLRADRYRFEVARSSLPQNAGRDTEALVSPKLSLILGPWAATEYFLNWGRGFHSNDARGTVARVDPRSREASEPVPGLVRTTGHEVGVRSQIVPALQTSLALWQLAIGSELVFVGDAGTTEPSRPSVRRGIEWSNRYAPLPWLLLDFDLALSRARFTDSDPAGRRIPGSAGRVASIAAAVRDLGPWSGSLQLRHLGPRPLVEDGRAQARASTLLNARIGYRVSRGVELALDVFNLLGRAANDIEYFYASRLRGEAAPVADVHFHPVEPRALRATVRVAL